MPAPRSSDTDQNLPSSSALAWTLAALTLACGLWGLWPHLLPRAAGVPETVRAALPATSPSSETPASIPTLPTTESVQPLLSGPLNLNTATLEQLEALPKVGPVLAQSIVGGRPYRSLDDLDRVKGVGPATLKRLAPLVTF